MPGATIEDGIEWLRETVDRLAVPRLGVLGLDERYAEEIVTKAARASSMQGNPLPLQPEELHAALSAAA